MRLLPSGHFGSDNNMSVESLNPSSSTEPSEKEVYLASDGDVAEMDLEASTEYAHDYGDPVSEQTVFVENGEVQTLAQSAQAKTKKQESLEKALYGVSLAVLIYTYFKGDL